MARARLFVHGKPGIRVEVTDRDNWNDALILRKAYGFGYNIYMWKEGTPPKVWRVMGEYGWRDAVPPKEIALANYLLEGE